MSNVIIISSRYVLMFCCRYLGRVDEDIFSSREFVAIITSAVVLMRLMAIYGCRSFLVV